MKLTQIDIENFLCHRRLSVKITPFSLICGPNEVGKTAIRDALSFAIQAELTRVSAKGDRDKLITEGEDKGNVQLRFGDLMIARDVATGKLTKAGKLPAPPDANGAGLPYILSPTLFARQDVDVRRAALLKMMGVAMTPAAINAELERRGRKVSLMGAPFRVTDPIEVWHEAAQNALKEARGVWKGITGETWGKNKGADWKAPGPEAPAAAALATAEEDLRRNAVDIEVLCRTLGQIEQAEKANGQNGAAHKAELVQRARHLDAAAEVLTSLREKLAAAQADLPIAEAAAADVKDRMPGAEPLHCPHCGAAVVRENGVLEQWIPHADPATELDLETAQSRVEELRNEIRHLQARIAITSQTHEQAAVAKAALDQMAAAADTFPGDDEPKNILPRRDDTERQLEASRQERHELTSRLAELRQLAIDAAAAQKATEKAAAAHERILAWADIADDLAPSGIPQTLLAAALAPLNGLLRDLAAQFQWGQPRVGDDMQITVDGRLYALRSESAQWRADALIAIAIASLTKLRLVVLDRFDVLEVAARAPAMGAFYKLTRPGGRLDTLIVIGTMKSPPAAPKDVAVTWIDRAAAPATERVAA